MKICTRCNLDKEVSEFYIDSRSRNPRNPCKVCQKEVVKNRLRGLKERRAHNDASRIRARGAELTQENYSEGLRDLYSIFF